MRDASIVRECKSRHNRSDIIFSRRTSYLRPISCDFVSNTRIYQKCEKTCGMHVLFSATLSTTRSLRESPIFTQAACSSTAILVRHRTDSLRVRLWGRVGISLADNSRTAEAGSQARHGASLGWRSGSLAAFPMPAGLPPASPIYIPQNRRIEIT